MPHSSNHIQNKGILPLFLLLTISLVTRLSVWWTHYVSNFSKYKYPDVIKGAYEHFGETILFQHVVPPLSLVLNKIAFLFGESNVILIVFLLTIGIDLLGIAFTYLAMTTLRIHRYLAFLISLILSIVLMRIQHPASLLTHDSPIYGLLPCYVWSIINYHENSKHSGAILVGIFAGLLILTSPVPGLVAVALTLLCMIFVKPNRVRFKYRLISAMIPLCLMFALCTKNFLAVGTFHVSTKGGVNGLWLLETINAWGAEDMLQYSEKHNLPQWWQWCYDNSPYLRMSGNCYLLRGGNFVKENIDFAPFKNKLKILGEDALLEEVLKDEYDYFNRPWFFGLGTHPEFNPRFVTRFNAQSQKLWLKYIFDKPAAFFPAIVNNMHKFFFYDGPLYPIKEQNTSLNKLYDKVSRILSVILAVLLWGGMGFAYINFIAIFMRLGKNIKRHIKSTNIIAIISKSLGIIDYLTLGFVMSCVLFNISSCCENFRYFWFASTYVLVIFAAVISKLAQSTIFDNDSSLSRGID